jgi:hypothetical protein
MMLDRFRDVTAEWYGAAAAAAVAGAVLLPGARILAGGVSAAAVLYLAVSRLPAAAGAHVCTGCSGGAASPAVTMLSVGLESDPSNHRHVKAVDPVQLLSRRATFEVGGKRPGACG